MIKMNKTKTNILITGGAGYLGSMISTELISIGYHVTVIDLLKYDKGSLNHLYVHKNFKLIKKDIRNINFLKKIIKKFDYIIPLAALVGAPLCEKFKKDAISTNFKAIQKLLKIRSSKNKIIFMTSNSGYGIGEKNKYCDENSPLRPISLYGKTKCDAEKIVNKENNNVCFRLATVFGNSYRMRSDLLVNNFVQTAIKKKKLTIFEPRFRRNFIHVKDVVNAVVFTIKNFNKMNGEIYNLGLSNANLTKIGLAKKIKKFYPSLKISIIKNRKDPDQRDYFVSNKKIEKIGFKPKVNLEDGINELINIFKNDPNKIINNY